MPKNTIDHIITKYDRMKYVSIDKFEFHSIIRTTHGLFCAREIVRYYMISRLISLDTIHVCWSKVNFDDDKSCKLLVLSMKHVVIVKKLMTLMYLEKFHLRVNCARSLTHPLR